MAYEAMFTTPNKLKRNDLFVQSFFFLLKTQPSILKLPSLQVWIILSHQVLCPLNLVAIFTSLLQFNLVSGSYFYQPIAI
jgi:hypothetical protein